MIGKTGSGKSSICDYLVENFRYEKLITCTTRKQRKNEKENEYRYISNKDFDALDLVCKTRIGSNKYGIDKKDLLDRKDPFVVILDTYGLEELKKVEGLEFISVFVDCKMEERYNRCMNRGDSPIITFARIFDEREFDDVKTDFVVKNEGKTIAQSVTEVLEFVKEAVDCSHQNSMK